MYNVTLWDSNSNSLSLAPNYASVPGGKKIFNFNRTTEGNLYHHTYGNFRFFQFGFNLLPASVASVVNSWHSSFEPCTLEIESGVGTESFSVYIASKASPFMEFSNRECNRYKGKLTLSEY